MFSNDRKQIRQMYHNSWRKHLNKQALDSLELAIVDVINEHPEYQAIINDPEKYDDKDFLAELGEANPYLHLGFHLSLREQIATNRPAGINHIYQTLCEKMEPHQTEHIMIEILAEQLWQAQRNNTMPDETAYLHALKELIQN